jgi:hypothetical protein
MNRAAYRKSLPRQRIQRKSLARKQLPKWTEVDTSGQEVTRVLHLLHDLQAAS